MNSDLMRLLSLQNQIFGICPKSGRFFRLSEARLFIRKKPVPDWMDELDRKGRLLDKAEDRLDSRENEIREKARQKGRVKAQRVIKKIDPVFTPRKLNPDEAKVLFHPVDYLVFSGMKSREPIRKLVFLDRKVRSKDQKRIQRSVEQAVEKERYDWVTLRVDNDGKVEAE